MLKLGLNPNVDLERLAEDTLRWSVAFQYKTLRCPLVLCEAVMKLADKHLAEEELLAQVDTDLQLYYVLNILQQNGVIWTHLHDNDSGALLATLAPYHPDFSAKTRTLPDNRYTLSRFAFCRRAGGKTRLESPLAHVQITIYESALLTPLWADVVTPEAYRDALDGSGVAPESATHFLAVLYHNHLLTALNADGNPAEEQDDILYQWTFHDLLFHQHSRFSDYQSLLGSHRGFPPHIDPQPAIADPPAERIIELQSPDIQAIRQHDAALIDVMETRKSIREQGDDPITVQQLSVFLYRSARVKDDVIPPSDAAPYERTRRPYPGGGACYELEIYLVVNRCDGLEPGLYHYEALHHRLAYMVDAPTDLNYFPQLATHTDTPPQIFITLTARFQRVSWKYDPIAYAAILKNVGVLQGTFALVATAMDLAYCPVGSGQTDTFLSSAPFLDPLKEAPVGEAVLGSR